MNETESPVLDVIEAVEKTIVDPSPKNLIDDLELAISLVRQLKAIMNDAHPSVIKLVRKLLF